MILLDILDILKAVPMTIQQSIEVWIANWLSKERLPTDFSVLLLLGDGSNRSFYRILTPSKSYILISDPQWVQTQDYPAHQSFLNKNGIPVPEFFHLDPNQGFLLMQDLGDELLQIRIAKKTEPPLFWLNRAVSLLADLHGKTFPVPADLPVAQRFFDSEKYFSEFEFTLEYLHLKLLNQSKLSQSQLQELQLFCQNISQMTPAVFSHRDYHCRNLLVLNTQLVMIDFQDARMGPPHYDLASLLYDAYEPITDTERAELLKLYREKLSKFPVSQKIDWPIFESNLHQVAFQRTIKAAGSFASFFIRFGKTTHWPYLSPGLTSALELQKKGVGVKSSVIDLQKWITLVSQIKIQ